MNRTFSTVLLLCSQVFVARAQDGEDAPVPPWRDTFAQKYEHPRDYGHDVALGVMFGIIAGEGVLLGAGPIVYEFGYRTYPYIYRMELTAGASIPTARYKVVYTLAMPSLGKKVGLKGVAQFSELEVKNFYGFGNRTPRDEVLEDRDFYRVSSRELHLLPMVGYRIAPQSTISVGLSFKSFEFFPEEDRFTANQSLPEVSDSRTILGFGVGYQLDTRDHPLIPHKGITLDFRAGAFPYLFRDLSPFHKVSGDLRLFIGDTIGTDVMLAVRLRGEKIFGDFPLYESAFLGGGNSLRGFLPERFAGDASAVGSAELRFSLFRETILIPTEVGLFLLADAGRVWYNDSSPGPWHTDLGGGIWLAPLNRDMILSVAVAVSVDGLFVNGGIGFGF